MKSPPVQYPDDEARQRVEAFIAGQEIEESSRANAPHQE